MTRKIDTLLALMRNEQWEDALRFAAKFPRLGAEKLAITRAKDCLNNPRFYVELGIDIPAAIEAGKSALIARYLR